MRTHSDINSLIVEGIISSVTQSMFIVDTVKLVDRPGGSQVSLVTSVLVESTVEEIEQKNLKKGTEVRLVGRLASSVTGQLLVVAEHIEVRGSADEVNTKEVEILVEEIVSEQFTVRVPESMDEESEEFREYVERLYHGEDESNGQIVLEPGNLELAHFKLCSKDGQIDMDEDWRGIG